MKMKGKLPMAEIGGALVGAVASKVVSNLIEKQMPNVSPMIKGGIIAVAGGVLAMQKSPILKGAGLAMVSVGGVDLASAFLPSGVSGVEDLFINSPADQSVLSAPADQSVLSGTDDYISEDYSINGESEYIAEDYSINGEENN